MVIQAKSVSDAEIVAQQLQPYYDAVLIFENFKEGREGIIYKPGQVVCVIGVK